MKTFALLPADMAKTGAAAKALEAMGYDAASSAETKHDPFLPCAIAAEHTQQIEIATGIAVAFARNPMTLANLGHDLNAFSKGRFNLGLGTQIAAHVTKRFSMPWSDPAPRMRELIAALHAIWDCWYDGKPLDFHGRYYTHTLMTPYFVPDERQYGRPKVMLAAVGPLMTKVAAEVADGMLCHAFTTPRYLAEVTVPAIEQTLQANDRDRSKFEIVATLYTVAGDTDEEIEKGLAALRQQVSFYGSTPAYRGVLELHGWNDLQPELNRLSKAGRWDEMAELITPEMCETFALIGTPEQIVERQKALFKGRIDRTSLNFSVSDPDRMKALIKALKAV